MPLQQHVLSDPETTQVVGLYIILYFICPCVCAPTWNSHWIVLPECFHANFVICDFALPIWVIMCVQPVGRICYKVNCARKRQRLYELVARWDDNFADFLKHKNLVRSLMTVILESYVVMSCVNIILLGI